MAMVAQSMCSRLGYNAQVQRRNAALASHNSPSPHKGLPRNINTVVRKEFVGGFVPAARIPGPREFLLRKKKLPLAPTALSEDTDVAYSKVNVATPQSPRIYFFVSPSSRLWSYLQLSVD